MGMSLKTIYKLGATVLGASSVIGPRSFFRFFTPEYVKKPLNTAKTRHTLILGDPSPISRKLRLVTSVRMATSYSCLRIVRAHYDEI